MEVNYLSWLQKLLEYGPRLKEAWPIIQRLADDIEQLLAVFKPEQSLAFTEALCVESTDEEAAAEVAIGALIAGENAAWDGSRLRKIFELIKLLQTVLDMLPK